MSFSVLFFFFFYGIYKPPQIKFRGGKGGSEGEVGGGLFSTRFLASAYLVFSRRGGALPVSLSSLFALLTYLPGREGEEEGAFLVNPDYLCRTFLH